MQHNRRMNPRQSGRLSRWVWLAIALDLCIIFDGFGWTLDALNTRGVLMTPEGHAVWLVLYCSGLLGILFAVYSRELSPLLFWNVAIFAVIIFVPSPPSWPGNLRGWLLVSAPIVAFNSAYMGLKQLNHARTQP